MKPLTIISRALSAVEAAALQVEELLVAELGDARLVLDAHVVLGDLHGRVGVGARLLADEQGVALARWCGSPGSPWRTLTRPR